MKTLTETQLNRNQSEPLRLVQDGDVVIITSRGKPVAKIVGISTQDYERTWQALALSPASPSPKSHFVIPPFLDRESRRPYKKEKLKLPIHLNWSHPDLVFDMSKDSTRAQLYEIVLREGNINDFNTYLPFSDLVKLWRIVFLPLEIRQAW